MPIETFFTVSQQARIFLLAVLTGCVMSVVCDVFRACAVIAPSLRRPLPSLLSDVILALVYACAFFVFSLLFSRGQLRLFCFIGGAAGFILVRTILGNKVIKLLERVCLRIRSLLQKVKRLICKLSVYLRLPKRQKK